MNTINSSLKEQAIDLRKSGLSYGQIFEQLKIPKSTLSSWLSGIDFSKEIKAQNIHNAKIRSAENIRKFNSERSIEYHKKIENEIQKYSQEIKKISQKDLFFIGLGLFMAEGSRKEKWMVRFVNSDPLIISIAMRFFREICQIEEKTVRMRIHIHSNCSDEESLEYWSLLTKVPKDQFYRPQTLISKSSKSKRNINQLKFGTLHVTIMSADILRKLIGWTQGVASQFDNKPG